MVSLIAHNFGTSYVNLICKDTCLTECNSALFIVHCMQQQHKNNDAQGRQLFSEGTSFFQKQTEDENFGFVADVGSCGCGAESPSWTIQTGRG